MIEQLRNWGDVLAETAFSQSLNATSWAIPLLQTIHIVFIACLLIGAFTIQFKVLGIFAKSFVTKNIEEKFAPCVWISLPVLLVTGSLLVICEPGRSITNPAFLAKMCMVVIATLLTLLIHNLLQKKEASEQGEVIYVGEKAIALVLLGLWVAIVFCGRWIAYVLSW